MLDLSQLLRYVVEHRASDLHLKVGARPFMRIDGHLEPLDADEVTAAGVAGLVQNLVPGDRAAELASEREIDFAYGVSGLGRFRVSAYRQRGSLALAIRYVLPGTPTIEALGLPPVVSRLAGEANGIVVVAGSAGSGRTTTVAAMLDRINEHERKHIVTLEDPIEYLHRDKRSIISQREVGSDVTSYIVGLRRIVRQDPDVIYVGEVGDRDTMWSALQAANTGRLVLTTLNAISVTQAIDSMLRMFPPDEHITVRGVLSRTLRGIVSQRLLERTDGRGRVPAIEALVVQSRVMERIINPDAPTSFEQIMQDGEYYGMQTFDQSLFQLSKDGLISPRSAVGAASRPHELKAALAGIGLTTAGPE